MPIKNTLTNTVGVDASPFKNDVFSAEGGNKIMVYSTAASVNKQSATAKDFNEMKSLQITIVAATESL